MPENHASLPSTTPDVAPGSPAMAWGQLREGNRRFVSGDVMHPSQGVDRRRELAASQAPFAVVFGCSDSRVAAEIIFDRGLGDLFVVRTAGHVIDTTVLGSIEYGVEVLGASLIVVLGHDSCGAVGAAVHTLMTGEQPAGFVRAVTDRVIPSIVGVTKGGAEAVAAMSPATLLTEHVKHTVEMLHSYSGALASAVAEGRLAIVGVQYDLAEGVANLVEVDGDVAEQPISR
ncbi:carbonic anhydrase [Luteimicrobium subarcticum]|uniref:carbonic anhydrase n=1 Tax=Luteimicrobium subarcticum TaxID=620910 RepID=A0A2M8WUT5_9MICO|nr:carbonic anhydrase [Luteimicrobium subarcticum]PJI94669.1 carbonic anhydrase [Luteimicrobium subarcticum]